jgi:hypothetical protein
MLTFRWIFPPSSAFADFWQIYNELLTFSSEGPMRPWEINYALVRAPTSATCTLHIPLCTLQLVIVEHFGPKASKSYKDSKHDKNY